MKAFKASSNNNHELRFALILFLLALLSGLLVQMLLELREDRASQREATVIITSALEEIHRSSQKVIETREAAAERMADLPRQKQTRLEDLQLDLLMVVSAAAPLPEGYVPELGTVVGDYQLDARCAEKCWQMMQDCRAAGWGEPMICSAYRTQEYQEMLYEDKVSRVLWTETNNYDDALVLAGQVVAVPGTSEHQTGLAADIMDETYPYLNEWQENTRAQQWLMAHCAEYGFILRYPSGASEITGIIYEPWHYRYVGEKFASEIQNRGITLEEYVAWRRGR